MCQFILSNKNTIKSNRWAFLLIFNLFGSIRYGIFSPHVLVCLFASNARCRKQNEQFIVQEAVLQSVLPFMTDWPLKYQFTAFSFEIATSWIKLREYLHHSLWHICFSFSEQLLASLYTMLTYESSVHYTVTSKIYVKHQVLEWNEWSQFQFDYIALHGKYARLLSHSFTLFKPLYLMILFRHVATKLKSDTRSDRTDMLTIYHS